MKKLFLIFVLSFFNLGLMMAKEVVVLKELTYPYNMQISENEIFISEQAHIYIYSLNDLKLIRKFGRKGEGPGEFITHKVKPIQFDVHPECVYVESMMRVTIFNRKGQHKKTIKLPFYNAAGLYPEALSNGCFVGYQYADEDIPKNRRIINNFYGSGRKVFVTINIYNSKFKKIKEVCREAEPVGEFLFPIGGGLEFKVYKNDIYVLYGQPDLHIDCFDKSGKFKYSIKKDNIERQKVSPENIENIKAVGKLKWKEDYERIFKKKMKFRKYWPSVKSFFIDMEIIYISTHVIKNGKRLWYLYDLRGNLIKQQYLPFVAQNDSDAIFPQTVHNDKLYQVVANENYEWELNIHDFQVRKDLEKLLSLLCAYFKSFLNVFQIWSGQNSL